MKELLRAAMLTAFASAMFAADVSYQETTTLTLHMYGKTAKTVFEGVIYIKSNQMSRELSASLLPNKQGVLQHASAIYDLDAGTVTDIDRDNKTYTVQTFDEMSQHLQSEQQRTGRSTDLQFDAKVTKTGRTRQIDGETATDTVITLTANDQAIRQMVVVTVHTWLIPMNKLRQQVWDFEKRLGEKLPSLVMGGAIISSLSLAAAIFKEMSHMDGGYPALIDCWLGADNPMAALNGGTDADPNAPPIIEERVVHNFIQGALDKFKFAVPAGYTLVKAPGSVVQK